jgi:hypothetical protein
MKFNIKLLAIGGLFTISCGVFDIQGSGKIVSENRDLATISMIDISDEADVEAQMGAIQSLTITTDDNIIKDIETVVENGKLIIRNKKDRYGYFKFFAPTKGIKITLTMVSQPSSIEISGSGKFNWVDVNPIQVSALILSISGSGNISLSHTGTSLDIMISGSGTVTVTSTNTTTTADISGSGTITLDGSSSSATLTISGSGKYNAYNYSTVDTTINISGSGTAYVLASGTLTTSISGSGSVYYKGRPTVSSSGGGSGTVKPG